MLVVVDTRKRQRESPEHDPAKRARTASGGSQAASSRSGSRSNTSSTSGKLPNKIYLVEMGSKSVVQAQHGACERPHRRSDREQTHTNLTPVSILSMQIDYTSATRRSLMARVRCWSSSKIGLRGVSIRSLWNLMCLRHTRGSESRTHLLCRPRSDVLRFHRVARGLTSGYIPEERSTCRHTQEWFVVAMRDRACRLRS